jgi:hypothetical protein
MMGSAIFKTAFIVASFVGYVCIPGVALSLPSVQTVSDQDGDASLTLRLLQEAIVGDAVSWCEVRLEVLDVERAWTEGDSVSAWVYEDDLTGDDLVWTASFTITSAELAAGFVDRTFDCSGGIDDDGGQPTSEVFAELLVDKDTCGVFCTNANPRTANLSLQWVTDDGFEEDDASGQAAALLAGTSFDRIANDPEDWVSFDLLQASEIEASVLHDPAVGRLDATLLDGTQTPLAVFQHQADRSAVGQSLPAGSYFVVIGPATASDPNFYDFELIVSPVAPAVPTLPLWLRGGLAAVLVSVGVLASTRPPLCPGSD